MKKNKGILNAMLVFLALGLMTLLLTSCGTTKGYGCGQASFIKNAHLCPAYH